MPTAAPCARRLELPPLPASAARSARVAEKPAPWPADAVERRPLAGLTPYARNARTHSESQVAEIARSIQEWGWTMPVLVDEAGGIIAGHGRVLAAQSLGLAEVPVMVARGWSDAQKRAYVLADNKLGLNAGWDDALLALELTDLKAIGFDTGLTGFAEGEVAELFGKAAAKAGLTDPDETPEVPAAPVSRLGDVWLLGRHRITCGDCTDKAVVDRVLAGAEPHLMVTDPPYGVDYDPAWRDERAKLSPSMGNRKDTAKGLVENDDRADWREAWLLFPGDVGYVWHAHLRASEVAASLDAADFELRQAIIWNKMRIAVGRAHYQWQHEPCWYVVRRGKTGQWAGDRKQSTVWDIDMPRKSETGHSTQKPVECMRRPIENNSKAGDSVYEPFSGSGTTIIAAEMTGRRCLAVELSPAYVDVAVTRWQAFAGETATLEGDGRTFAEIAANGLRS